jgi:hypothetical protein
MLVQLKPHPDTPSEAVGRMRVDVERSAEGGLSLRYLLGGVRERLRFPEQTPPMRADDLWKHACFEAFVRGADSEAYYEFNFAPSTQWAAYRFDRYREGMSVADEVPPPTPEILSRPTVFELSVSVQLRQIPGPWRLALSAVVEETSGVKSYWALAHPPGKPDFHHPDGFVLELP